MSLFSPFKKRNPKTPMLIFDIGGTSVGAALVFSAPEERPFIVHTTREWIRPLEKVSIERLIGLLEAAIDSAARDILSLGRKRLFAAGYYGDLPATLHCFVTAPWYAPHTSIIRITSKTPFTITQGMLTRAVAREKEAIEKNFGFSQEEKKQQFVIMENQVLSLSVNGYKTENPYKKSARELEFSLYTALAERDILNRFAARIRRAMHADEIPTHSFLLAFFSVIRDLDEANEDFLLVDVSGEVTEVSVVRNGELRVSVSYPLGRNFLARALAIECTISFEEALSLLATHSGEQGNDILASRFRSALASLEKKWMREFEESLSHIAGEAFLPHAIFVAADKTIAPWVTRAIQNEALYQYTLTAKPFVTNLADEKMLDAHVSFGPGLKKDPFLMVDAMFLNKLKI